ncbi:MAG: hypothetical protein KAJ20_00155 [Candidatus Aenigmarchaeota archaeon]|nr:hypothetical protein [Candidatus Aenigmarchaeota archaeon]MCK5062646.1 hypothetical protein [Candidatus Aenigmarchaeota archaeon]MCK5290227.1 hypothetical protein [Candidatus Aenigmarchaeota archaeon]MCK5372730.1 hypothetical protein [Candidatus Aenigmarchaeota archaeon]MCK5452459.1 hypothetical protein [Candidatus Aenigmarchaeota archaeon]
MKRKAVSDILALVIIIAIMLSIASMFTYWSKDYAKDVTSEVSHTGNTASVCMREFIDLSELYINTSSDTIEFIIENKGTSEADIVSAVAYNLSGSYCAISVSGKTISPGGITLVNGSACSIYSSCDTFDNLEVTTSCGTHAVKRSIDFTECS